MNVDVSPDGRQIVFDLLGDLYVMPLGGSGSGLAERLTSGAAFDMQPRFSPDGKSIAFTSDRDGLLEHLGDGARRQRCAPGEQGEALVRQQPDLVARRAVHLRAAPLREGTLARRGRDLDVPRQRRRGPAGHREERLAEGCRRAGALAGRPVPLLQQGRHARRDFEYNKDPYGTIYAILRRDLDDRQERHVASRPGGSITPRVSPDGKTLAFIRRVRLKTVLFVRDLASGRERPVCDGLDHDKQEAWAIHGVYPQYAWTPDGTRIVIWGAGQDLARRRAGGAGRRRSRSARGWSRRSTSALRFAQEVHAGAVPGAHAARRHDLARRDARRLQRAGQSSRSALPDGEPRRLTSDDRVRVRSRRCRRTDVDRVHDLDRRGAGRVRVVAGRRAARAATS